MMVTKVVAFSSSILSPVCPVPVLDRGWKCGIWNQTRNLKNKIKIKQPIRVRKKRVDRIFGIWPFHSPRWPKSRWQWSNYWPLHEKRKWSLTLSRTLLLPVEKLLLLRVQRSIPSLQTPTTTLRPNHLSSSASDITPHLKTRKTILEYIVIHYPLMLPSPASEIDALQNSQRQQFVYNASSHLSPRR